MKEPGPDNAASEWEPIADPRTDRNSDAVVKAGPRCLVVMYHYVHDRGSPTTLELPGLTSREFGAQLDRLLREMEPIDWPTLYAFLHGRSSLPPRCFLLTFDDGLSDHAETVMPMLQARGLRGVFFVTGATLTSHRMLPAHAVHLLLARLDVACFERELMDHVSRHVGREAALASFDAGAADTLYHYETPERARLKYWLTMGLPIHVRNAALEALFERHIGSSVRWARRWYLGWDDLTEMQARGHTVGGHGYAHEPYARLDRDERQADLRRVAAVLGEGLGADVRPFSYPYGSCDFAAAAACRKAGFCQAFTTRKDWIARGCDPMRLARVDTIEVDAALREDRSCATV